MKYSEWICDNVDSYGIYSADVIDKSFRKAFANETPTWSTHTSRQTAIAIDRRGKGGTLAPDAAERLCYGYEVAEAIAAKHAGWQRWQSGLGFRYQSAVEALRAKGL